MTLIVDQGRDVAMDSISNYLRAVLYGSRNDRPRALWRGLVPFLVMLGLTFVGMTVYVSVVGSVVRAWDLPFTRSHDLFVVGLIALGSFGAAFRLAKRIDRREYVEYGLENSCSWWTDLVGGLLIGFGMAAIPSIVGVALGYGEVTEVFRAAAGTGVVVLGAFSLFGLLVNVVGEELLFRSVMLQNFAEGMATRSYPTTGAVTVALVGSSVVFGLYHIVFQGGGGYEGRSLALVISSALFGLVWGIAYMGTGKIALPLGMHLGYNVTNGLVLSIPPMAADATLPTLVVVGAIEEWFWESYALVALRTIVVLGLLFTWLLAVHGRVRIVEDIADPGTTGRASPKATDTAGSAGDDD